VVFAVIIVGGVGNNIGLLVGALIVETLLIHLPAFLPEIPGHTGLIEHFDAMLIGILLMVMLWFRPQGLVPERLRSFKVPTDELLHRDGHSVEAPAVAAGSAATNPTSMINTDEGDEA
jgi:hypothetical protein